MEHLAGSKQKLSIIGYMFRCKLGPSPSSYLFSKAVIYAVDARRPTGYRAAVSERGRFALSAQSKIRLTLAFSASFEVKEPAGRRAVSARGTTLGRVVSGG